MRFAEDGYFPEFSLAVVNQGAGNSVGLRIKIENAFADGMAWRDGFGFNDMNLAHLPADIGEAAALATEIHVLEAIRVLELIGELLVVVVIERHQQLPGLPVRPFHFRNSGVVAIEVFNHDIGAEESIGCLPRCQATDPALKAEIHICIVLSGILVKTLDQELGILEVGGFDEFCFAGLCDGCGLGAYIRNGGCCRPVLEFQEPNLDP